MWTYKCILYTITYGCWRQQLLACWCCLRDGKLGLCLVTDRFWLMCRWNAESAIQFLYCLQSWQICFDRLIEFFSPFLFTYMVCKHIIMLYIELHLQVLGPTRDWHCSNCCCCPCAHLGPRSGAVNKWHSCWPVVPRSLWCGEGGAVGGGRGRLTRGMQAHFPSGDRTAFISRKAGVSLLPVYLKATENSQTTSRRHCAQLYWEDHCSWFPW